MSPLLRQLLILAVDLPSEYDPRRRAGRIMSLLVDEIRLAPALPLSLPFPGDARLAARCRRFIERPTAQDGRPVEPGAGTEPRRACLLSAVPRLPGDEAVTTIAFTSPHAYRRAAS